MPNTRRSEAVRLIDDVRELVIGAEQEGRKAVYGHLIVSFEDGFRIEMEGGQDVEPGATIAVIERRNPGQ